MKIRSWELDIEVDKDQPQDEIDPEELMEEPETESEPEPEAEAEEESQPSENSGQSEGLRSSDSENSESESNSGSSCSGEEHDEDSKAETEGSGGSDDDSEQEEGSEGGEAETESESSSSNSNSENQSGNSSSSGDANTEESEAESSSSDSDEAGTEAETAEPENAGSNPESDVEDDGQGESSTEAGAENFDIGSEPGNFGTDPDVEAEDAADDKAEKGVPEDGELKLEDDAEGELGNDEGSYYKNHQRTFALDNRDADEVVRRLQAVFATLVQKVAEDRADYEIPYGDDVWDIEALMVRRYNKAPLHQCRTGLEKQKVVLMLDTSGSCYEQAELYAKIAQIALRDGDVEIYEVPNGGIVAKWGLEHGEIVEVEQYGWEVKEEELPKFKNRVILYFGDFDGGDTPTELALENQVYWFSNEDRYDDMDEHSWCSYTLQDFFARGGKYFEVFNEEDFIWAVRKVR